MARIIAWLTLVISSSCGKVSAEEWNREVAKVSCQTLKRCDPISFHRDYTSVDLCVNTTEPGDYRSCTYDEDAASRCLDAMEWNCAKIGRRYDEVVERCNAVWSCENALPTADTGGPTLLR
ncbi:MAG: hypothetical protein KTR31_21380 [Myxococcales bacterium]|nr:hypothetical protein [Myxococcales bacterium]